MEYVCVLFLEDTMFRMAKFITCAPSSPVITRLFVTEINVLVHPFYP